MKRRAFAKRRSWQRGVMNREVTRYDFSNECDGESGSCRERLVPDVSGDWVRYEDYAAVVAEREALQERIIAYSFADSLRAAIDKARRTKPEPGDAAP